MTATIRIHPSVDGGVKQGSASFTGGVLICHCDDKPVRVAVKGDIMHNHACGCSKCWKPEGALFAVVAVIPRENVEVLDNGDKLAIVDQTTAIQRHACKGCGVHLIGRIENGDHAFYGLDFIHADLFEEPGSAAPTFAAFVSSIIETGYDPAKMSDVRTTLQQLGLAPFDCLSPPLMDAIATHIAKQRRTG